MGQRTIPLFLTHASQIPISSNLIGLFRSINSNNGERAVDPLTDLLPLCSNCHRMIHKPDPMLSIEELKKFIHQKN